MYTGRKAKRKIARTIFLIRLPSFFNFTHVRVYLRHRLNPITCNVVIIWVEPEPPPIHDYAIYGCFLMTGAVSVEISISELV